MIPPNDDALKTDRTIAEKGLIPLGLAGLYDPPRLETSGAVQKCKIAGISVHMLTGDHIKTATAIAHEVGIIGSDLTAAEAVNATMPASAFDALSDAEIDALDRLPLVLARCSPSTKVRMVEAMHRRGAYCVMTGDGVNDSPALKKADVGIAMGLNGSDVAKEAADMVLTDDNFASIVTAVEEGRRLFDNIQKVRSIFPITSKSHYDAHQVLVHSPSPNLQYIPSSPPPHRPSLQGQREPIRLPALPHRDPLGQPHHILLPSSRPRARGGSA